MQHIDAFLVVVALCGVGSFFLCGVPFGLIISELTSGVDVRKTGSGNIGMTNVARSVGAPAAALTLLLDAAKGALAICLSRWAIGLVAPEGVSFAPADTGFAALTLVYLACVLGHVFSPYLDFHGGKGISVGLGAGLALLWPWALAMLATFLVVALPTRYVSAGSICAAISASILAFFVWHTTAWATLPLVGVTIVVVWAHRGNIVKLIHGEERRFTLAHK
jgi:glycerol-3-phosphate acyltransferase PlsY